MRLQQKHLLSRRHFCLCCMTGAAFTTTGGWLTPRQAFAEARGIVTLIKDSAASSPVTAHKLRGNVSVLEGSGGNIAVLRALIEKCSLMRELACRVRSSPKPCQVSAPSL